MGFSDLAGRARPGVVLLAISLCLAVAGNATAQEAGKKLPVKVLTTQPSAPAIEFCLPLARGELADAAAVRVADAKGQELPLQVRTLSVWPEDKSMRVLWLSVQGEKRPLTVEYGRGVQRKAPQTALKVDEQADGVTVTTGPVKFCVSAKELKVLDQVWLDVNADGKFADDEALLAADGARTAFTTLQGAKYVAVGKPQVAVEDSRPLYATVCVRGELAPEGKKDAAPEERLQITYRIKAWAGSPALSVQHVLARSGRVFLLDPPPDDKEQRREWSLLIPVESYGIDLALKTPGGLNYCVGGDRNILDQNKLAPDGKRLMLASGDYKTFSPNLRFEVEGKGEKNGAMRWLDVSAGAAGVGIAVRDGAELFPKSYEATGAGKVTIGLWHDDPPRAALEIGSGFHRTHDVVLSFHKGAADVAHGEAAVVMTVPTRAAVPSEQFRTSGVFGLMPKSLDHFPELPEVVQKLSQKFPVKYGEHLRGDPYSRAPDELGRQSQSPGIGNPILVYGELYAAMGNPEYLDAVDGMGRWMRDWYAKYRLLSDGRPICQYPEPSNTLILMWSAPDSAAKRAKAVESTKQFNDTFKKKPRQLGCVGLTQDCRVNPCFVKGVNSEGLLYHYYLTGDPESRVTAAGFADFYHELLTNNHWYGSPKSWIYDGGDRHRFHLLGPWMADMVFFYEGLGDAKYLDALKSTMASIMKGAHADFPDDDYIFSRTWIGNAPWAPRGNQHFAHATFEYLRLAKDESIKPFASKLADYMIKNSWDEGRREFYYRPALPRDMSKGWVPLTRDMTDWDDAHKVYWEQQELKNASVMAWCYQTTGNEKYADIARKTYTRWVELVKEGKLNPTKNTWTLSIDWLMEDSWNYFYVMEQLDAQKGR